MSNDYDDDTNLSDSELVRKLRGVIKDLQKENGTLSSQVEEFKATVRTKTLSDAIAAKNLNPKIAALVPKDLADDQLDDWLTEYGDVFGGPPAAQQQDANAATAAEATRMAQVEAGASHAIAGDLVSRINQAESWDELQAILQSS